MRPFGLLLAVVFLFNAFTTEAAQAGDRYLMRFEARLTAPEIARVLQTAGLKQERFHPEIGLRVVEVKDKKAFKKNRELIEQYAAYLEKDFEVRTNEFIPNDDKLDKQHWVKTLDLTSAWEVTQGSHEVVIAVSDTGLDFRHTEFQNNLWVNKGEIPDNGIDDDGNGYVDDVYGHTWDRRQERPQDSNGHGTHVAGIIGAEGNNEKGVAGVNWRVSLMTLRFLGREGSGTFADGIATILYAVNNGARVVNCSWGGPGESSAMDDVMEYAYSKGTLVVVAAGNTDNNVDLGGYLPASANSLGVLPVAASAGTGNKAWFSSWGLNKVGLAAPGQAIFSTWGRGFRYLDGTSMATPMVSGVAGLMLAVRPSLTVLELRNGLLNSAKEHGGWKHLVSTSGEVNANNAVRQLSAGFQVWPGKLTIKPGTSYPFTAFDAGGAVEWSVEPAELGTIDAQGVFTAGQAKLTGQITAKNLVTGQVASTEWTRVSGPVLGCASQQLPQDIVKGRRPFTSEDASLALSFSLPFLFGFIATRRRRVRS